MKTRKSAGKPNAEWFVRERTVKSNSEKSSGSLNCFPFLTGLGIKANSTKCKSAILICLTAFSSDYPPISDLIHLARCVKFNRQFNPWIVLIGLRGTEFNRRINLLRGFRRFNLGLALIGFRTTGAWCLILQNVKHFSKWLIIADNVVDLCSVCKYLPQTACEEWGHGQVLITTQDSSAIPTNAPHTYHESLSTGMQPGDAVELLEQVSQISNDEQVQKVAEVLEYQPLALAAAAFYVQFVSHGSPTYGWTNYLERLTEGGREVTEEPLADKNPAYSKTMTSAIKLALESILESNDVLRQTFLFFSLCDSEPLPIQAAVNFVNIRTSGKTDELIKAKILNSSLIMPLYSEDEVPTYLRVHNVVHQVLRKMPLMEITEKYQCFSTAVQVFHSIIESEQDLVQESGDVCILLRRITTHCKALHEILTNTFPDKIVWLKELAPFITLDNVILWLCSTASVCLAVSNPSKAILFSTSACDFLQYISSTRNGDIINIKQLSLRPKD